MSMSAIRKSLHGANPAQRKTFAFRLYFQFSNSYIILLTWGKWFSLLRPQPLINKIKIISHVYSKVGETENILKLKNIGLNLDFVIIYQHFLSLIILIWKNGNKIYTT